GLAGAPEALEWELNIGVHNRRDRFIQKLLRDMTLIDKGKLETVHPTHRASRLHRPQIAAVTEDGEQIPLTSLLELGLQSGDGTEWASPVEPMFRVVKGVKNLDRLHAVLD